MKLTEKGAADWQKGLDNNKDAYGAAVYQYAQKWAELMEDELGAGRKLEDIAEDTSRAADMGIGITGFMYGCAVSILSKVWAHGEQLRQWHNLKTQIRDEGVRANASGGVLNPAVLNIG